MTQERSTRCHDRRPWIAIWVVDHQRTALVAVTLPWCAAGDIQDGRAGI
jgi:hypothetical protein